MTAADPLRQQLARRLFEEFVTGSAAAWTSQSRWSTHYRTECYRLADELLAERRAYAAAQLRDAAEELDSLDPPQRLAALALRYRAARLDPEETNR